MTWWITDTSIGQRLKFVRRFRRLTQKELGLLMGYSEKTADVRIAQYEKNARTPNAETTAKLAEVLKVSPVVFSPTICASREDLLQSMYWLFLMKGGGDIDRIGADLEKARKKRVEWDARVKDLERRYREEENSEIHEMVHAANLNPEQLSELLRMFAADMAPKPDTINTMNEEETQNEI